MQKGIQEHKVSKVFKEKQVLRGIQEHKVSKEYKVLKEHKVL